MRKETITQYSKNTLPKHGLTDWKRIDELKDTDIDVSDIPILGSSFWEEADVKLPASAEKERVTIRLDKDVVNYIKAQVGTKGYQTHINNILRSYVDSCLNDSD